METKEHRLGEYVDYYKGYAFNSNLYSDEGIMVVRVSDFTLDSISRDNAVYIQPCEKYDKFKLCKNDVLIQTVGSWANNPNSIVGKVVRVPMECEGTFLNQNIVKIFPKDKTLDNDFLFYYLKATKFSDYCVIRGQGAANQASITLDTIFRYPMNLPPLPTQQKIASILSAYDNLIQNYKKQIEDLQTTASELYKEWFVRFRFPGYKTTQFENGIPVGWKVETANEMFNISIGKTPPRAEQEWFTTSTDDVKWVSISDMNQGIFIEDTSEKLTASAVEKFKIIIVPKDTVLLSFKLTVGKVSITKTETCTNEAIAHFKLPNLNMREYIFNYLSMFPYQKLGNTSAIGTAINSQIVKKMKIVVPTKTLLDQYHTIAGCIFDKIGKLGDEITNLTQQRDLLLPRLMSGKIEIKNKGKINERTNY